MSGRSLSWLLLVIRVVMGGFFLMEAFHQVTSGYIGGDDLHDKLEKAIDDKALPGYRYFLEHVALNVDDPLTVLVIVGEIAVGVGLVFGLFTRLTAIVAIFMNANFFLMNGLGSAGAIDLIFIVGEVIVLAYASGQALSFDELLARRGLSGPLLSGPVGTN